MENIRAGSSPAPSTIFFRDTGFPRVSFFMSNRTSPM